MHKTFLICALMTTHALSSCGFQPMYGRNIETPVGVETYLANVSIGNIPNREGLFLRNELIDRFYRNARPSDPIYNLEFTPIEEVIRDLDITVTSDATRGQLLLTTSFTLYDKRTREVVLTRSLRAITSFNILVSEFTNQVSEQAARENAINDLARQVELQLNLYFKRAAQN